MLKEITSEIRFSFAPTANPRASSVHGEPHVHIRSLDIQVESKITVNHRYHQFRHELSNILFHMIVSHIFINIQIGKQTN